MTRGTRVTERAWAPPSDRESWGPPAEPDPSESSSATQPAPDDELWGPPDDRSLPAPVVDDSGWAPPTDQDGPSGSGSVAGDARPIAPTSSAVAARSAAPRRKARPRLAVRRIRALVLALITLATAAWLGVVAMGNGDAAPDPADDPAATVAEVES